MVDAQKFIHWYFEEFRLDPLYLTMADTVEDSPWHRERNVGVHTDMVVSTYLNFSGEEFDVRGAIGCAFHDVGKPSAEIIKFREDRGEYRAYHGHEQVSARMWEDWAVRNWTFLETEFEFVPEDLYAVGWMIEHHVPWGTKKDAKLNAFAATAYETIGLGNAWVNMLLADQYGRISDPDHQRYEEAAEWTGDHVNRVIAAPHRYIEYETKTVFMLIGPPGCGKSTFREILEATHKGAAVLSMDDLRMEWYGSDYATAFQKSTKDSSFNAKVDKVYIEMLRENDYIILDNTNTAARARNRWMAPARARNFRLCAVLFPSTVKQVVDRQKTRDDKTVPADVVKNMYDRLALPMYGLFDQILVVDANLPS